MEAEHRMKKLRDKADEIEKSQDGKSDSSSEAPRVIRRPRRSVQIESAPTLTDLMEKLQSTSMIRPPTMTPAVREENITVAIPNESGNFGKSKT